MSGWLGVVSAEHVRRGIDLGIAQIGHGKRAPLARMAVGDTLVYYSPVERLGDTERLQHFTAHGVVADEEIWQADEGEFKPYRRRIRYAKTHTVALADVREQLHLTAQPNWGYQLRRGLVTLDQHDLELICASMEG